MIMELLPGDQRLQKRTVGEFIRLYIQRRRDSSKVDNTILTSFNKRSMSDSRLLRRRQLEKQASTDVEYEEETKALSKRLSFNNSDGRDSSTSSDSQSSFKKEASVNEIKELYSALQDLVNINVTATPLSERRATLSKISPVDSPRLSHGLGKRTSTSNEKTLRKASLKVTPSESFERTPNNQLSKHKRGLSMGTIDVVTKRISPFINRKFSHDLGSTTNETKKISPTKTPRLEQKKWRGAKLFNLLRSHKNSSELSDDNDDKLSTDDDEVTPYNNSKRRLSDFDALEVGRTNSQDYSQEDNEHRKSLNEETKKEIEQLVASLNINSNNDNSFTTPTKTIAKDFDQLDQLESWFEQAAAESLNNRPERRALPEDSSSDVSPDVRNNRPRKKQSTNSRRGARVRRISSNKDERKTRKGKLASKSYDFNGGMTHSKSTPDLFFDDDDDDSNVLTDKGVTYKVLGQLNHVNNNKVTSKNNKTTKRSREGTSANRFPDFPMFYLPTNDQNEDSDLYVKNNTHKLTSSMFYTEKENNAKNNGTLSRMKKSKCENRPKSMFDYFDKEFNISDDENSDTNTESIKNSVNKDTNANFCRANIISSQHALSVCDLSTTTMVQEKSLWEKIKRTASSKKTKAVIA